MHWSELAILVFGISIFGVEGLLLRRRGIKVNKDQALLNLSLGMVERLFSLLSFSFGMWVFASFVPFRWVPLIEPGWLNLLLAVLGVDLFWYLYHRISHRVSLIWVAHLVHHQSEDYNFSVNFANSPLGYVVRIIVYSPLILLGLDPEYVVLANIISAFYQAILHSELWPAWIGWERILVTPRFHQIHHSSAHAHLDKNYGGILTIWDRLMGSYHDGREPIQYGLTKPIEQPDPFYVSTFYAARLIQNFREFPIHKAVALLFAGPERQPEVMPKLYRVPVRHSPWGYGLGFALFLVGYVAAGTVWVPFWAALVLSSVGIVVASGIVPLPSLKAASRARL